MSGAINARAESPLSDLSPAFFGLVMATGIVSLAAFMVGHAKLAFAMFWLNVAQHAVLSVLYGLRAWHYPGRFFGDMIAHPTGPGYFTMVAGTGILASQFLILGDNLTAGTVLSLLAFLLWLGLNFTIFTAFAVQREKPALDQGINGSWLLAVVAMQALSVCSTLLAARMDQPYRLELNVVALSMWLSGGMLYTWIIALIFYRLFFFRLSPGDLVPSYWINMGAMAISTLAGSQLILNAANAPYLASLLPFLKGLTVLCWATGTWWIPMLLLLGVWRYGFQRFPLRYVPLYWAVVFPLGMYAACTWQMDRAMQFGFLQGLARAVFWIALAAWGITFLSMLNGLIRGSGSAR